MKQYIIQEMYILLVTLDTHEWWISSVGTSLILSVQFGMCCAFASRWRWHSQVRDNKKCISYADGQTAPVIEHI